MTITYLADYLTNADQRLGIRLAQSGRGNNWAHGYRQPGEPNGGPLRRAARGNGSFDAAALPGADCDGGCLERALAAALKVLSPGGRLVVISFHSLEDRLVKQFMRRESQPDPALAKLPMLPPGYEPRLALVGRKLKAGDDELRANPRSRSAILRVAERLAAA